MDTGTEYHKNIVSQILVVGELKVYFMRISPELAAKILNSTPVINRNLNKYASEKYLGDMKADLWNYNGDTLRFNKQGYLIDGQHRLVALTRQKNSYLFLIVEGIDDIGRRTIDTGKIRTAGDHLALSTDVPAYRCSSLAVAIKLIRLYDAKMSLQPGGALGRLKTTAGIQEFFDAHFEQLVYSLEFIWPILNRDRRFLCKADAIFLHYIFSGHDDDAADIYLRKIITGESVEPGSNETLVRSIMDKHKPVASEHPNKQILPTVSREVALYSVIRGWNKNMSGGVYRTVGDLKSISKTGTYIITALGHTTKVKNHERINRL